MKEIAAELIGAFIGDGFMNKYEYMRVPIFEFAGDKVLDKEYFKTVLIPYLKELFPDSRGTLREDANTQAMRLRFYDKRICFWFMNYGFSYGPKSHTVQIPSDILVDENLLFACIRGIFDTDGCVYLDNRPQYKTPYPRIAFTTVSENLFSDLIKVLEPLFPLYLQYHKKRNAYMLEIYGHKNLRKWMKTIGFSNPRHLSKVSASVAQR